MDSLGKVLQTLQTLVAAVFDHGYLEVQYQKIMLEESTQCASFSIVLWGPLPRSASDENSADHSTKVVLLAVTLRTVIVCSADMNSTGGVASIKS